MAFVSKDYAYFTNGGFQIHKDVAVTWSQGYRVWATPTDDGIYGYMVPGIV